MAIQLQGTKFQPKIYKETVEKIAKSKQVHLIENAQGEYDVVDGHTGNDEHNYVTVGQVKEIVGVNESQIYKKAAEGGMLHFTHNKVRYFNLADANTWAENRKEMLVKKPKIAERSAKLRKQTA